MKHLAALALALLCAATACAPTTPPASPTASVTFVVGSPIPTLTVVRTPSAVPPTPDVPYAQFHPIMRGLGTINVLEAFCYANTTWIFQYATGTQWVEDDAARRACIARGTI